MDVRKVSSAWCRAVSMAVLVALGSTASAQDATEATSRQPSRWTAHVSSRIQRVLHEEAPSPAAFLPLAREVSQLVLPVTTTADALLVASPVLVNPQSGEVVAEEVEDTPTLAVPRLLTLEEIQEFRSLPYEGPQAGEFAELQFNAPIVNSPSQVLPVAYNEPAPLRTVGFTTQKSQSTQPETAQKESTAWQCGCECIDCRLAELKQHAAEALRDDQGQLHPIAVQICFTEGQPCVAFQGKCGTAACTLTCAKSDCDCSANSKCAENCECSSDKNCTIACECVGKKTAQCICISNCSNCNNTCAAKCQASCAEKCAQECTEKCAQSCAAKCAGSCAAKCVPASCENSNCSATCAAGKCSDACACESQCKSQCASNCDTNYCDTNYVVKFFSQACRDICECGQKCECQQAAGLDVCACGSDCCCKTDKSKCACGADCKCCPSDEDKLADWTEFDPNEPAKVLIDIMKNNGDSVLQGTVFAPSDRRQQAQYIRDLETEKAEAANAEADYAVVTDSGSGIRGPARPRPWPAGQWAPTRSPQWQPVEFPGQACSPIDCAIMPPPPGFGPSNFNLAGCAGEECAFPGCPAAGCPATGCPGESCPMAGLNAPCYPPSTCAAEQVPPPYQLVAAPAHDGPAAQREASFALDCVAHEMEQRGLYEQADRVRALAQELRQEARSETPTTPVVMPTPWMPGPVGPGQYAPPQQQGWPQAPLEVQLEELHERLMRLESTVPPSPTFRR